jgi:2-dehydro-3-deoxygluconokinase
MQRVVTFGEIMLRLTTPGFQRIAQARQFEITFGGAEANVAVAIARFGGDAAFVTKLPENEVADKALTEIRGLGVDIDPAVRGGERIGVYYLEQGASQRAGKVIYDRAHSAIAEAVSADFDWNTILGGATWFHWSGITPALSSNAAQITLEACRAAQEMGLTVSFDLNYRAKLWTKEQAGKALRPLMQYVNLCVTSAEEAKSVFGIDSTSEEGVLESLRNQFAFDRAAFTRRQADTADRTRWSAILLGDGTIFRSREYEISIVDRVGAGDSFTGALIFSLMRGDGPQEAIELAVAASALKHTVPGDYNLVSLAEAEALAAGASGGRVQR